MALVVSRNLERTVEGDTCFGQWGWWMEASALTISSQLGKGQVGAQSGITHSWQQLYTLETRVFSSGEQWLLRAYCCSFLIPSAPLIACHGFLWPRHPRHPLRDTGRTVAHVDRSSPKAGPAQPNSLE